MKKSIPFLIIIIILFAQNTMGQKWQWGFTAGSNSANIAYDRIEDFSTDEHGNSYVMIKVEKNGLFSGSVSIPNGKGTGVAHTMLVSYDCKGQYRWSKVLGSGSTLSLKVSKSGQVYIFGLLGTYGSGTAKVYYDTDTVVPGLVYQRISLACYDTLGNYKWLRRPDSVSSSVIDYNPISMDIDDIGNCYCLVTMPPGDNILGSSLKIPPTPPFKGLGVYVLKYSPTGSLLTITRLQDFSFVNDGSSIIINNSKINYNKFNNGYFLSSLNYLDGGDSLYVKGLLVKNNVFFGSYQEDGSLKWHLTDTSTRPGNNTLLPIHMDDSANIFLAGGLVDNNLFNGHVFHNPICSNAVAGMPFIMKMDSNGVKKWCVNGGVGNCIGSNNLVKSFAANQKYGIISSVGKEKHYFGDHMNDTVIVNLYKASGTGQEGWYAVIDIQTGQTLKLSAARGPALNDGITALKFRGNDLYMAGYTESDTLTIDSTFKINKSVGTGIDVFIAKYAFNCECIGTPTASFYYNPTNGYFTYTGSTPADSVTWDFGDGSFGKGLFVYHSYSKKSIYKVCATLWSPICGPVTECKFIDPTLDIKKIPIDQKMILFPNPFQDILNIEGLEIGTQLGLFNTIGQNIIHFTTISDKHSISLKDFPNGLYYLKCTDSKGNTFATSISKQ